MSIKLVKNFFIYLYGHLIFLFYFFNMVNYIVFFFKVNPNLLSLNKSTWLWHTVHLHMVAFDLLIFCFWFFCWGLWKFLFHSFLFLWTFVWSEWYWPHNMRWEVIHLSLISDRVCVDNFTHLFFLIYFS